MSDNNNTWNNTNNSNYTWSSQPEYSEGQSSRYYYTSSSVPRRGGTYHTTSGIMTMTTPQEAVHDQGSDVQAHAGRSVSLLKLPSIRRTHTHTHGYLDRSAPNGLVFLTDQTSPVSMAIRKVTAYRKMTMPATSRPTTSKTINSTLPSTSTTLRRQSDIAITRGTNQARLAGVLIDECVPSWTSTTLAKGAPPRPGQPLADRDPLASTASLLDIIMVIRAASTLVGTARSMESTDK